MTVAEARAVTVRFQRSRGVPYREIAAALGISYSHAKTLGSDRSLESSHRASREAKRRRTGSCVDCGAPTRYDGHAGREASLRCQRCANLVVGLARRGTGPRTERALAFLSVPRRYSELRVHMEMSDNEMGPLLFQHLLPKGYVRRVSRGVYVRADVS